MTNPLTEMDERRKVAAAAFDDNAERHEWYAGMVRAIRQSDEANHIGYHDTRTHVVVARAETIQSIIDVSEHLRMYRTKENKKGLDAVREQLDDLIAAILAAQEDDNG